MRHSFWRGKKVFVTGHTGFKGSWLTLSLLQQGADVYGYALPPLQQSDLYHVANLTEVMGSQFGDIRDLTKLQSAISSYKPDIIFHLGAQPLVRASYDDPIETFSTNVMGTVHLLEAARQVDSVKTIINVTSDKCYENKSGVQKSFVESDPMGGHDPYSASKGCAEIVSSAYSRSFYGKNGKFIASARAGNVIGGGDWSKDRIIPDFIRAILNQETMTIRQPKSIRPWQHVLDCIHGYMLLAEKVWTEQEAYVGAWNFGPSAKAFKTVEQLIECSRSYIDRAVDIHYSTTEGPYEAGYLVLDSGKAEQRLGWVSKLTFSDAVKWTMDWYDGYLSGLDMTQVTSNQIRNYHLL
ncbi:CDP-glucose 4,6-dehydratase [Paenibacillus sp. GSMTC-2017]|uniref:CDP-glucose 4,6-dehydratase n=1 Tax=Paenibacillus sp. GSMTC-2017 TaxID=2794350 RepID=UPI0018D9D10A|nr:CDP-glucose 4,6-dehydratase [Paenibacillus sp. GSMTC-2017]MBH5320631.1 CDP-glucose 4,6-dehydratase [Paenibacillus sp. GSMTC-2017]